MDWNTILTALIASIGGTGVLLAIAFFLGKNWLGTKIEESVKHEYAKKLEEHKTGLQEQLERSLSYKQAERNDELEQREIDKKTFKRFLEVLPSSGNIDFLKNTDIKADFNIEDIRQLRNFSEWDIPDNYFLDDELEHKRKILHEAVENYYSCLAPNIFSANADRDLLSIPRQWAYERPEHYDEVIKKLKELAGKVVDIHEDIVLSARKKLKT